MRDDREVFTARIYGTRFDYVRFEAYLSRADTRGIHSSGFYSQGTMYTFAKDRSTGYDRDTERTVRHEYVHYLTDRFGLESVGEPWFDEGLAEFLAGSTQAEGMRRFGSGGTGEGEAATIHRGVQAAGTGGSRRVSGAG